MKTVQDKDGNVIQVADNAPCHAGKNGALPILLDATLDAAIFAEMAERETVYNSQANNRQLKEVRRARRPLIEEADIQINKHADLDHVNLSAWRIYRQALRDVTNQADLFNITWPTKPATLP